MNEKIKEILKNSLGYLLVATVSLIYIATAFLTIGATGKTLNEIIADGIIVFIVGFIINRFFDTQGLINGDRNEKIKATTEVYKDTITKVLPYIDKLDEWCELQNNENKKQQRTKMLAVCGLKYDDYFSKEGLPKDYSIKEEKINNRITKKNEIKKYKCFKKAVYIKLTPLSSGTLISEGQKTQDKYNLGKTKQQYEKNASRSDVLSKIGMAIVFGYFGIDLAKNFDYKNLIWTGLQVVIFLIIGLTKMYSSYMFVVDEYRNRIIRKINILEMFFNYITLNTKEKENGNPSRTSE